MQKIFGLEFVKSEYSLKNFRIDSLSFDTQTKSFVIIEYKNTKNFSVVDQGYSYLSLMLNNKSDFILEYNEVMNKNLKKSDIEWSQSRVIFVSPIYTRYQKESINFKDLPIELWEIKKFQNNTILYSQIKSNNPTESIKTISKTNEVIDTVTKEVKTYSEDEHLKGKSAEVLELYEAIKPEILNLGEVSLKATKLYIAFVENRRNIVCFVLKINKIKVYINLKFSEISDYKNKIRDITSIGSWGTGDCEFTFDNMEDLDYLMSLIKQSYKKNS